MRDFLAMGGYGFYVWSAYAVFFIVLLADLVTPLLRRRQILRELKVRLARQDDRASRGAGTQSDSAPAPRH